MDLNAKTEPKYNKVTRSLADMAGWFQMVLSRSKCWPSIISLALIGAEKWTLPQNLNLKVHAH